ncbi:hypothetical protein [Methylobacterium dankookense]|uniref:Uncharacterized protein n=2 Tax=Methylobacterium dankookense TaxID=560405 RepID=A0A564FS11_9HYPH|nr:hypothetical protein [Methylobacterium dankookense]GJD58079.1 hypothetical protein IFDJLNFL_3994 [Methylobacterium dankookense]VUF10496.1 hypothetical protein MTDSW087_00163 [Methylobacterium dankookense]
MAAALSEDRRPSASDFGGLDPILSAAGAVASSAYAPEFFELVLDEADPADAAVQSFSGEFVDRLDNDIGINALVDLVADRAPLPEAVERRWFRRWLALAEDRGAMSSVRTAALRGALLMKRQSSRRSLMLSAFVVNCEPDDEPGFLAHAARIAGLLHAETPNPGTVEFLEGLLGVQDAADEATFELGMERVGGALRATNGRDVLGRLREARTRFEAASAMRDARADARVLSLAIGLLDDFYEERVGGWSDRVRNLGREAFAYSAYSHQDGDFLNGAKAAEVSAWASLAIRLGTLGPNLDKPAWWDAARIIENELLAVYSANRTIFRRSSDGGLEWLVRPRIEHYFARHREQLYALRDWIGAHAASELGATASELVSRADAALGKGADPDPSGAAIVSPTVAAVIEQGEPSFELQERLAREVIANVNAFEARSLTPTLMEALALVLPAFEGIAYFDTNPNVRTIVQAVVYKTLLFLESRMDPSLGVDPTVAYLFTREDEANPLEKEIQQDFMRFIRTAKFGTVDELRGVAAGRADVVHQVDGVRFITEVKREEEDASFDNLLASYGDQTSLYQNTNVPIGILLVLDLTTKGGLSGHFRTLYRTEVGNLLGDGTNRGVLIVKVPGRRIAPSAATVEATKRVSKAKAEAAKKAKVAAKAAAAPAPRPSRRGRGRKSADDQKAAPSVPRKKP